VAVELLIEQVLRGRDPRRVIAEALLQEEGDPAAELTHRIHAFVQAAPSAPFHHTDLRAWSNQALELAAWFSQTFTFLASRTPTGMKDVKVSAEHLYQMLLQLKDISDPTYIENWVRFGAQHVQDAFNRINLPRLVAGFSRTEAVPGEVRVGGNHYINEIGLGATRFKPYVDSLETLWGSLQGWRRKALDGGLTVVLAGPSTFGGTSAGKYQTQADRMLVRATPRILKRTAGTYGSPDYILVHELGHRYEHKHHIPAESERLYTTRYSQTDALGGSEAFAELFALGHYGGFGKYHEELARFEQIMAGHHASA
jgi:hypothetical protein